MASPPRLARMPGRRRRARPRDDAAEAQTTPTPLALFPGGARREFPTPSSKSRARSSSSSVVKSVAHKLSLFLARISSPRFPKDFRWGKRQKEGSGKPRQHTMALSLSQRQTETTRLVRVASRPVLLAREDPDPKSRPVLPIPTGTIVEVSEGSRARARESNARVRAPRAVSTDSDLPPPRRRLRAGTVPDGFP